MPVNDSAKANAQNGAIKVDVGSSSQEVVGRLSFGEQCYGGELVFVPRHQDTSALKGRPGSVPPARCLCGYLPRPGMRWGRCSHEHGLCPSEPFPRWVCLLMLLIAAVACHGCPASQVHRLFHVHVYCYRWPCMRLACALCSLRAFLMPFVQHVAGLHGQPCHATWPRGQARSHDLWVELDHLHSVRGRLTS